MPRGFKILLIVRGPFAPVLAAGSQLLVSVQNRVFLTPSVHPRDDWRISHSADQPSEDGVECANEAHPFSASVIPCLSFGLCCPREARCFCLSRTRHRQTNCCASPTGRTPGATEGYQISGRVPRFQRRRTCRARGDGERSGYRRLLERVFHVDWDRWNVCHAATFPGHLRAWR